MIRFSSRTQIVLSDDLAADLAALLEEEQARHVTVVVDDCLAGQPGLTETLGRLTVKADIRVHQVKCAEPTTALVNDQADQLRGKKTDLLIGIGGGSVMDLTKAVSVMLVNPGKVEDYHGTGKAFNSGIRKILVPITAGTGSEVTPGAVLLNKAAKFKRSIGGRHVAADYALLNPRLTLSMPDPVSASTGLDALGHAVESYTAKSANEITRMYSREAFKLICNNLPKIFEDRGNLTLRGRVLLGSCLAGFAIFNSNTGAGHSISYALGIYHDIPHGVAVGLLLSKVVSVNVEKGCLLYADLYDLIDGAEPLSRPADKARKFAQFLAQYPPIKRIGKRFGDYGLNVGNYKFAAERGLDLTPALSNNPVEFNRADSERVLKELL